MSELWGFASSRIAFCLASDLHLFKSVCFINAYWPKARGVVLQIQC